MACVAARQELYGAPGQRHKHARFDSSSVHLQLAWQTFFWPDKSQAEPGQRRRQLQQRSSRCNIQAMISQLQEVSRHADVWSLNVQNLMFDQVWHPCQ